MLSETIIYGEVVWNPSKAIEICSESMPEWFT